MLHVFGLSILFTYIDDAGSNTNQILISTVHICQAIFEHINVLKLSILQTVVTFQKNLLKRTL